MNNNDNTPPAERPTLTAEENNAIRFNDAIAGVTSERPTPITDKFLLNRTALRLDSPLAEKMRDLERQLAESREQRDRLASAIRSFSTDFEEIRWGWDGDCGSDRLAERLLNEMTETMKGSTNESR